MRGNSKYLRWAPLYTCCCVFVILSSTVIGVPVRPRRMIRETYSNFDAINSIANATCLQDGVEVQKSSIKCDIKSGCRAIQKTGECCPEFQCDCTRDDKTYANGEKIADPVNPCRVCVCKGGEITCSDITCYVRDDCKPRYVTARCCPEYDNCPPLHDVKLTSSKENETPLMARPTLSKNDVLISLTTTTASNNVTPKDRNVHPTIQLPNDNPLGIKIKEITKPEEIRITDDKPKAFKPTKSTTITSTTKDTVTESSSFNEVSSTTTVATSNSDCPNATKKSTIEDTNPLQTNIEPVSNDYMDDGVVNADDNTPTADAPPTSKATIDTVGPAVFLENADSNSIGDDSSNKSVRQATENSRNVDGGDLASEKIDEISLSSTTESEIGTNNSVTTETLVTSTAEIFSTSSEDSISVSSSTTELDSAEFSGEKQPVVQVGDDVVIVHHSGQTKSITVIGASGLQRVEDTEFENKQESDTASTTTSSSAEEDSIVQSSEQSTVETITLSSEITSNGNVSEMFDDNSSAARTIANEKNLDNTLRSNESNDANVEANSSKNIASSEFSTESVSEASSASDQVFEPVYFETTATPLNEEPVDTVYFGSSIESTESSSSSPADNDLYSSTSETSLSKATATIIASTAGPSAFTESSSTQAGVESTSRFVTEYEETDHNENPEFPHIPDDVSIHNTRMEEDDQKRRLASKVIAEEIISTTIGIAEDSQSATPGKETANNPTEISTTVGPLSLDNVKMVHEQDVVEARAPGEPLLIPEWERTTTESIAIASTTIGIKTPELTNAINKTTVLDQVAMQGSIVATTKADVLLSEKLTNDLSSEEINGKKEPTTERSTTKGYSDIDDDDATVSTSDQSILNSSSTTEIDGFSPKDDAESIKLNEDYGSSDSSQSQAFEKPSFGFMFDAINDYMKVQKEINGW